MSAININRTEVYSTTSNQTQDPDRCGGDSCMKLITELFGRFHVENPLTIPQNCTIVDTETDTLLKGIIIFLTMVILILSVVIILLVFTMQYRKSTSVVPIPYTYDEPSHQGSTRNRSVSFQQPETTPLISV